MNEKYLPPGVAKVLPMLDDTCSAMMQEVLKRALTDYTKELCEDDPELADILLEGTKALPRCLLYVLQQAQTLVATQVESMGDHEINQLGSIKVHGVLAKMAGAAVEKEKIFEWAKAYYYGGKDVEPKDISTNSTSSSTSRKTSSKSTVKDNKTGGTAKKDSTENKKSPAVDSAATATQTANGSKEIAGGNQLTFGDITAPGNDKVAA